MQVSSVSQYNINAQAFGRESTDGVKKLSPYQYKKALLAGLKDEFSPRQVASTVGQAVEPNRKGLSGLFKHVAGFAAAVI